MELINLDIPLSCWILYSSGVLLRFFKKILGMTLYAMKGTNE